MSASIRQSSLFAAEDYKKVFQAYNFIDYTAYDFDSLKQALINYIQVYYPEDFNDYIESSEFIAIVELIAYMGTSLAFRSDMNSRENFIDTAERRESVIRLAQMVNYVPRRNIPANGLFKITAVQTNQPLVDAMGVAINDRTIFWNDPNNPDWFDQFIQVCNAVFSSPNPFGRPSKSGTIGNIPTDLYELNNVLRISVTYPTVVNVNGQQFPVDICNPDFVHNQTIFERHPDPLNAFNFIYRNDSLGMGSANTGFFLYFRQGSMINIDTNFDFPVPNRVFPITTQNINQDDVYVQETDGEGNVLSKWKKVPALSGENIIYNSIALSERNIFDVISGPTDTISIRFADGNFGNVPTGLFRTWVRTSANQNLIIRPESAQGLQISIPYVGVDNQQYNLTVVFGLEQTISNSAPAETNDQIKLRAPEVFSTQSRMVNGSDYNVLPLIYGNQIAKIKALERTYSGQSRYIDVNDPTGFHRDLIVLGQDGVLYRDDQHVMRQTVMDSSNASGLRVAMINVIQDMLRHDNVANFFYDEYLTQFESVIQVNAGRSLLDLTNPRLPSIFWKTSPFKFKNSTGFFADSTAMGASAVPLVNNIPAANDGSGAYSPLGFIKGGAVIQLMKNNEPNTLLTVAVNSVIQSGLSVQAPSPQAFYTDVGPVELSVAVPNNYLATRIYPVFRSELNDDEVSEIDNALAIGVSFWMYYDLLRDRWGVSTNTRVGERAQSSGFVYPAPTPVGGTPGIYSDWSMRATSGMLYVNIQSDGTSFELTARGRAYVFQSYKDVRFYWDSANPVINGTNGRSSRDTIEILPFVNTRSGVSANQSASSVSCDSYLRAPVSFNIAGAYTQADGYTDTSRVEVTLPDNNFDGIADDPGGFSSIVSRSDRVVFERYTDHFTGYRGARPWVAKWSEELVNSPDQGLYVYFPINPSNQTELFSAPYIANMEMRSIVSTDTSVFRDPYSYQLANPGFKYVYLDEADLIFIDRVSQLKFESSYPVMSLANQLTAFINGPQADDVVNYPWLRYTHLLINKSEILETFFHGKSFLIAGGAPGRGEFYVLRTVPTQNTADYYNGKQVISELDLMHFDKNGKSFTQNTNVSESGRMPMHFKWSHYSPIDQRVDPSPSNIIDMIVVTYSYYNDMQVWKKSNGTLITLPVPPTTEELRIQFQDLNQYKMISDSMVWNSGRFKILFGPQAAPELQATFKVVKSPTANISDNEVKVRVINAIDTYFDIRNWDFGERFFYTELAAFIHQQLSRVISSVVIVPNDAGSKFGDLFEIVATESELFMSTATVMNVQIISNLSDQSLRI